MPHDLVTIAVFPDAVSAQAARGHLVAHGLRAFVLDEHASTLMPHLDMALGVRLQVPRSEAERAHALLAEAHQAAPGDLDEEALGHEAPDAGVGPGTDAPVPQPYRSGEAPWLRRAVISAIVVGAVIAALWLAGV